MSWERPTKDERLLDNVIKQATTEGLLKDRLSLAQQNAALRFFVAHAPLIREISPRALMDVAEAVRAHPDDWQEKFRAGFRTRPRNIEIPDVPAIAAAKRPPLTHRIILGDFLKEQAQLAEQSVDLVLTSPPYAEQRKKQYESIREADYPAWSVEWMRHVKRVLKPHGSAVINIQPSVRDGVESSYVRRMCLALEDDGWKCIRTLIWDKISSVPMGDRNRPRRIYEYVFWFSLTNKPYADPRAAGHVSDQVGAKNFARHPNGDTFKKPPPLRTGVARMTDIIRVSPAHNDKTPGNDHPAQYSTRLCTPLIKLLTRPGDMVVDPFAGTSTSIVAAKKLNRSGIGFEKTHGKWVNVGRQRLKLVDGK